MAARWDTEEPFNWALLCRSPCCDATRCDRNVEEKCVGGRFGSFCAHLILGGQGLTQHFTASGLAIHMCVSGGGANADGGAFRLGLAFVEIVRISVI
ncbi:hypothetical protein D3C71_2042570 [compost metagenome]